VRRLLLSPPVIIPLAAIAVVVIGFLIYYWTVFSGRIDNLLKGEVFTRSAGILRGAKTTARGTGNQARINCSNF